MWTGYSQKLLLGIAAADNASYLGKRPFSMNPFYQLSDAFAIK